MPSDIEIKQMMTEKGIPFFEGGGLDDLLERIADLERKVALLAEGLDRKAEVVTGDDGRIEIKES